MIKQLLSNYIISFYNYFFILYLIMAIYDEQNSKSICFPTQPIEDILLTSKTIGVNWVKDESLIGSYDKKTKEWFKKFFKK